MLSRAVLRRLSGRELRLTEVAEVACQTHRLTCRRAINSRYHIGVRIRQFIHVKDSQQLRHALLICKIYANQLDNTLWSANLRRVTEICSVVAAE